MSSIAKNLNKRGFTLDEIIISFVAKCRFYVVLLSKLDKVSLKTIPTAGVGFNKHGKLTLYYNPDFLASLTLAEAQALIEHECCHIVYRHLSRFPLKGTHEKINAKEAHDNKIVNWGTDCAINQYIDNLPVIQKGDPLIGQQGINGKIIKEGDSMGLYPSTFDMADDLAAEAYVAELRKRFPEPEKQEGGGGKIKIKMQGESSEGDQGEPQQGQGHGELDSHDLWGKMVEVDEEGNTTMTDVSENPDIDPEYECEAVVNKAIKECKDYGKVPSHIQKEIERLKSVKRHDWKKTLKVFINTVLTIKRRMTQKRVDRRLSTIVDYLAPGKKKDRKPKILYVRDTSGSMFCDSVQAEINAELEQLAKRCEVIVADCDTKVHQTYRFKKASDIKPYQGGGGTSFVDAFKVAGKLGVDGIIYATDTYGDFPREKEIGKLSKSTIWLTFNQEKVQVPFGRHVNIIADR